MIDNPIIFYTASVIIVVFGLISIVAKNIINSLLAAIVVFLCGALFFYVLGSEYNAIIQAAIYGLAVPVIIGISIMFLARENKIESTKTFPYLVLLCTGIFVLAFVYLMLISLAISPDTFNIMEQSQTNSFETIKAFAAGIFVNYVWTFELVSLLLTIIVAGISLIGRKSWK